MSMQPDDTAPSRLDSNCQRCQAVVTLTDVHKVSEQLRREFDVAACDVEAAGHEGSLASSYVDVNTAGPSTSAVTRVAGKPSGHQNLTHILELATTQTHVDHPLCAKCLDNVARELQDEAQAAEEQAHAYEEALATLQEEQRLLGGAGDGERPLTELASAALTADQLRKRLEDAELEEKVELERSLRLEAEVAAVEQALAEVAVEEAELAQEEADCWRRHNALWLDLQDQVEELDALAAKTAAAATQLEALRQTSVLEDCFHIWFRESFGTISGFRLGRLRDEVPWQETNAAWGQAVLLLDMLTRLYPDFSWSGGVLKPMASYSEVSDGRTHFRLWGPTSGLFNTPYDRAMVLYLGCLDAFARFIRDKALRERKAPLPMWNAIDVERGSVAGYSIKYSGMTGNPDVWNKALKCLLVNLKVLLAWVTSDVGVVDAGSAALPPQMAPGEARRGARGFGEALSQTMRMSMFAGRGGQQDGGRAGGAGGAAFGGQSMFQM